MKDIVREKDIYEAKKKMINIRKREKDNVTFQSIYTTGLISFRDLSAIELLDNKEETSMRDYLNYPGNIFLLNNPGIASEQHGALSLFLTAFMMELLGQSDIKEGELRSAVILDEALTFHLPDDVERAVYTQSRSKGLCVIACAQRLPKGGERGGWADQSGHIFGMRSGDLETRQALAKRVGGITYREKEVSRQIGDRTSSRSEQEIERQHDALAPEDWTLKNRQFILFHESGIAPGEVRDINFSQRPDVEVLDYNPRSDIGKFMEGL
jgi:hypothetical protein